MKKIDWEKMYSLYDGEMDGCSGAECPLSCCGLKDGVDEFDNDFTFNTILGSGEVEYLKSVIDFESLDFEFKEVSALIRGNVHKMVVLSGCLGEDGCKLSDSGIKPIACRTYPFKFSHTCPVDVKCPSLNKILSDNDVIASIARFRDLLGYSQFHQWLENLCAVKANVTGDFSPIRLEKGFKLNS